MINSSEKAISSSEAHQRVKTSPAFKQRASRAQQRLQELLAALQQKDWSQAFQICWHEFEDMHQLFTTAQPAFDYRNQKVHNALKSIQEFWQEQGDGPLVTMDAGPNIHLLWRPDQASMAQTVKSAQLFGDADVL